MSTLVKIILNGTTYVPKPYDGYFPCNGCDLIYRCGPNGERDNKLIPICTNLVGTRYCFKKEGNDEEKCYGVLPGRQEVRGEERKAK